MQTDLGLLGMAHICNRNPHTQNHPGACARALRRLLGGRMQSKSCEKASIVSMERLSKGS